MKFRPGLLASILLVSSGVAAQPTGAASAPLFPSSSLELGDLEALVADRDPAVKASELALSQARADVRQARLLGNPTLDLAWGTIPIGETNPPDLQKPLARVPSYEVGLSYTFELGKRSARLSRAEALRAAARHDLNASVRARALELARLLGAMAASSLRLEGLRGILESGRRQVQSAQERLGSGFGTELDVERLGIDVSRTEQSLREEEGREAATRSACASYVGRACRPFSSSAEAREFLARWLGRARQVALAPEQRSDVRALSALSRSAASEAELARAAAIPDPTVRVGYVRDQFVLAGAQQNSLNVSVSIPLPVFDHGQAQAESARGKREAYLAQRALVIRASRERLPALQAQLGTLIERQTTISSEIVPRAVGVLKDVERAAELRLISVADVVQARRTVSELLVEEAGSYADAFDAVVQILAEEQETRRGAVAVREESGS